MNPGRIVLPLALMIRLPFGIDSSPFLPIDFILSPSTTIAAFSNAGFPVPSINVPPSITTCLPEVARFIFSAPHLFRCRDLSLVELLDKARRLQFLHKAHVHIPTQINVRGFGIGHRQIVHKSLYSLHIWIRRLAKNHTIGFISPFESLLVIGSKVFCEELLWWL